MTATVIIGKLLPYIIGLLAALAAWLKGHAEVQSVKKDREETKKVRDDSIQRLSWELNRMKEDMNHQNLLNEDFRQQLTMMNSTITEVKTLVELLVDNKIKNGGH